LLREHAADRPLDLAMAHAAAADVLARASRPAEALQQARAALSLREEVLGANHPLLGESLLDVGAALRATGDDQDAVRHLRRGLQILERAYGPDDPRLTEPLFRVGETLVDLGLTSEALTLFR